MELAESGVDKIIVSLQGMSEQVYREICGHSFDFDEFYERLKILYESKKNTEICIKIPDVALGRGDEKLFYERFSSIADKVFVERIVPIWRKDGTGEREEQKAGSINKFGYIVPDVKCCSIMFYTMYISPLGVVYPCTQAMMTYDIGDVHGSTLKECWGGEKRRNLLIAHLTGKRASIEDCKDCYVAKNSIVTKDDLIDDWANDILSKISNSRS